LLRGDELSFGVVVSFDDGPEEVFAAVVDRGSGGIPFDVFWNYSVGDHVGEGKVKVHSLNRGVKLTSREGLEGKSKVGEGRGRDGDLENAWLQNGHFLRVEL